MDLKTTVQGFKKGLPGDLSSNKVGKTMAKKAADDYKDKAHQ